SVSSAFVSRARAHTMLRVQKRANYFLEEIRPGNLERECVEEKCSFEEAQEIFRSREKTLEFWFHYQGLNPCRTNPCENGGVCSIRHHSYACLCPPRFGGARCEQERLECWYKNGGCWQYCRDRSAFHAACSCTRGYALHEDGKRCVPAEAPPSLQLNVDSAPENDDSRITGGSLCHRGHCPWQVLIRDRKGVGFCGGTLISSRWVVTAAHCLDLVRPDHVTVGDFDKYQREFKEQKVAVERSWPHPHYDSNDYNSDIALLYLSSAVVFDEFALPLCLPSPGLAALLSEAGRVGLVSGWGATYERGAPLRFLMKVRMPIVPMETCQQSTDRLVTDNMFCAGYGTEAADACKGDSGGPFAVSYHNTWFLVGVVSWGEGCAQRGRYGVYTRVSNYLSWIKETVE
ncbi:FA9 factor, partial [Rhinopomastus cyanomelas]|nr:FA9 factor [Rhinopomastus cyanomelas]